MLNKSIIVRLGVLFSICLPAARAVGVDNTFQPPSSPAAWHTASNWSLNQVPTDGQNIVIPSDEICNLDTSNGVADSFDIDGVLNITGVSLTIDGSIDAAHSLTGDINLTNASASLQFIDRDHVITGTGWFQGMEDGARIEDDGQGRTLTFDDDHALLGWLDFDLNVVNDAFLDAPGDVRFNEAFVNSDGATSDGATIRGGDSLVFSGSVINSGLIDGGDALGFDGSLVNNWIILGGSALTISGSTVNHGLIRVEGTGVIRGSFVNSIFGTVEVDGTADFNGPVVNNGDIQIEGTLEVNGRIVGSGAFAVAGGELTFSSSSTATSLTGDFHVTAGGEVHVNAKVRTSGSLKAFSGSGSKFIIAAGKSISFK